jgi:K+-sensing histidine kinase KdpD
MPPRDDPDAPGWHRVQVKLHRLFVHDLKNPISALTSNLSYLESSLEGRDEDLHLAVTDCMVASKLLLHMANNLSAIAALEAGEQPRIAEAGVADLARDAAARVRELTTLGEIAIGVREDFPALAGHWEIPYVELALDNLILCSVANAPSGSQVDLGAAPATNAVRFSVCDDGQPVAAEHRRVLFDRNHQSEAKSALGARYGRALGLYAVGLVTQHLGGRVEAGVTGDGRAEFALSLPLEV